MYRGLRLSYSLTSLMQLGWGVPASIRIHKKMIHISDRFGPAADDSRLVVSSLPLLAIKTVRGDCRNFPSLCLLV